MKRLNAIRARNAELRGVSDSLEPIEEVFTPRVMIDSCLSKLRLAKSNGKEEKAPPRRIDRSGGMKAPEPAPEPPKKAEAPQPIPKPKATPQPVQAESPAPPAMGEVEDLDPLEMAKRRAAQAAKAMEDKFVTPAEPKAPPKTKAKPKAKAEPKAAPKPKASKKPVVKQSASPDYPSLNSDVAGVLRALSSCPKGGLTYPDLVTRVFGVKKGEVVTETSGIQVKTVRTVRNAARPLLKHELIERCSIEDPFTGRVKAGLQITDKGHEWLKRQTRQGR